MAHTPFILIGDVKSLMALQYLKFVCIHLYGSENCTWKKLDRFIFTWVNKQSNLFGERKRYIISSMIHSKAGMNKTYKKNGKLFAFVVFNNLSVLTMQIHKLLISPSEYTKINWNHLLMLIILLKWNGNGNMDAICDSNQSQSIIYNAKLMCDVYAFDMADFNKWRTLHSLTTISNQ